MNFLKNFTGVPVIKDIHNNGCMSFILMDKFRLNLTLIIQEKDFLSLNDEEKLNIVLPDKSMIEKEESFKVAAVEKGQLSTFSANIMYAKVFVKLHDREFAEKYKLLLD